MSASTHLTILLLSKLIISVTSTLSDNEYSQLNRNSKKKKKKKKKTTHEISNYFQEKGLILSLEVMTLFLFFFLFAQD